MPHNLLLAPAAATAEATADAAAEAAAAPPRVFVIPRRSQRCHDASKARWHAAVAEVCGLVSVHTAEAFDALDESAVARAMAAGIALDASSFEGLAALLCAAMARPLSAPRDLGALE